MPDLRSSASTSPMLRAAITFGELLPIVFQGGLFSGRSVVMGISVSSASSRDAYGTHAEHVYSVAERRMSAPGAEHVSISWQRCANTHGLDPVGSAAPRILTRCELGELREPLDDLILSAQEELDRLFGLVRQAGYTLLFCDTAGGAIEPRGDDPEARRFARRGTWLGGVWSEKLEDTHGILTCTSGDPTITLH